MIGIHVWKCCFHKTSKLRVGFCVKSLSSAGVTGSPVRICAEGPEIWLLSLIQWYLPCCRARKYIDVLSWNTFPEVMTSRQIGTYAYFPSHLVHAQVRKRQAHNLGSVAKHKLNPRFPDWLCVDKAHKLSSVLWRQSTGNTVPQRPICFAYSSCYTKWRFSWCIKIVVDQAGPPLIIPIALWNVGSKPGNLSCCAQEKPSCHRRSFLFVHSKPAFHCPLLLVQLSQDPGSSKPLFASPVIW